MVFLRTGRKGWCKYCASCNMRFCSWHVYVEWKKVSMILEGLIFYPISQVISEKWQNPSKTPTAPPIQSGFIVRVKRIEGGGMGVRAGLWCSVILISVTPHWSLALTQSRRAHAEQRRQRWAVTVRDPPPGRLWVVPAMLLWWWLDSEVKYIFKKNLLYYSLVTAVSEFPPPKREGGTLHAAFSSHPISLL